MKSSDLAVFASALGLAQSYLVAPPGTPAPGAISSCSEWVQQSYVITCDIIEQFYGMTAAEFEAWSSTTTTTSGNGVTTPSPTQAGVVSNCNKFHLVVSGDDCYDLAATSGITLDNFYAWNPTVGSTCANLWLGYYVCVGIISSTTTTTASTTKTGNAIATPTPYQAGLTANCDSFHLVITGDSCYDISAAAGITLANFYAWNPAVGSTCGSLLAGYYTCIGIL
ncbi:hypothetical protein ONZ43_g2376 [Nemania bipapillata]|uniref:Uncharacterized protein n=1 Tax=Nemania bipapillata TaxID=110536 RepID=A0ACC2J0W2_9PEZI|nr:hypothetical protein ONZ43_g2376 [Nemania bipapillata]